MKVPTTASVLDEIVAHKRTEVATRRRARDTAEIEAAANRAPPVRGFRDALAHRIASGDAAVIAEIKKASPSKGIIRAAFDVDAIARSYAQGGATCLSVLTDERFFMGHNDNITIARRAVPLPILRKDFIIDPWQIYESRALGADCVLLIVAALGDELADLYRLARAVGLDVLTEVHDRGELERALDLNVNLVGINNRDLRTFKTNLETTYGLLDSIPDGVLTVTESGINTAAHVTAMRDHNVHAFLVGEAFMRVPEPGAELARLFANRRS
jgi:indole-3-glycerol phosphate synthase